MARPTKTDTQIRTALETVILELAIVKKRVPVTRLRVSQAQVRTGLTGLLSPALDELDDVARCVSTIDGQIAEALSLLRE